jgi:hypothetical protein
MQIQCTAEFLYRLQTLFTGIELLFEGKWWAWVMKKSGIEYYHGLTMQAHNELVRVRSLGVAWDYTQFRSKEYIHRMFQDPLHQCADCRTSIRMRPTLKNRILKRMKIGKYKYANLAAVDY